MHCSKYVVKLRIPVLWPSFAIISILRIMLSDCNGFRSLLGSEVGVRVADERWPGLSRDWG